MKNLNSTINYEQPARAAEATLSTERSLRNSASSDPRSSERRRRLANNPENMGRIALFTSLPTEEETDDTNLQEEFRKSVAELSKILNESKTEFEQFPSPQQRKDRSIDLIKSYFRVENKRLLEQQEDELADIEEKIQIKEENLNKITQNNAEQFARVENLVENLNLDDFSTVEKDFNSDFQFQEQIKVRHEKIKLEQERKDLLIKHDYQQWMTKKNSWNRQKKIREQLLGKRKERESTILEQQCDRNGKMAFCCRKIKASLRKQKQLMVSSLLQNTAPGL